MAKKPILKWLLDDLDTKAYIKRFVIISNQKFIGHFKNWQAKQSYTKPMKMLDDGSGDIEHGLSAVKDI